MRKTALNRYSKADIRANVTETCTPDERSAKSTSSLSRYLQSVDRSS
jgi:hypothetical protein